MTIQQNFADLRTPKARKKVFLISIVESSVIQNLIPSIRYVDSKEGSQPPIPRNKTDFPKKNNRTLLGKAKCLLLLEANLLEF